jgi:hypothetical protein
MSSQISSIFSGVLLVPGRPERSSSSADTRPALKRQSQSETAVRLKECSPKVDLAGFMQNLMQTICLILPSIHLWTV